MPRSKPYDPRLKAPRGVGVESVTDHEKLPPQKIRADQGVISHHCPLIRPYLSLVSGGGSAINIQDLIISEGLPKWTPQLQPYRHPTVQGRHDVYQGQLRCLSVELLDKRKITQSHRMKISSSHLSIFFQSPTMFVSSFSDLSHPSYRAMLL